MEEIKTIVMKVKESNETFTISHLRRLGEYIDEMDLILLQLYNLWVEPLFENRKLNESEQNDEQTLLQKFVKNNELACKEIEFIKRVLPSAVFTVTEKNIFEKTLVKVVEKYRTYNTDYNDLVEVTNENLKLAHKDFLDNMNLLDKKINEYNKRDKIEPILTLRQANSLAQEKEKEIQNKKDESFEEILRKGR